MLISEVAVLKSRHGISVKCSRYRDTGTNLMKLAGIFRDLEQLHDFQTIGYGGHFVFQNEAKILHRQVFIAINIPCKFGEDIFINE